MHLDIWVPPHGAKKNPEALALSCTIFWHLALSCTLRGSANLFHEYGIQVALCWSQSRSTSNGCYLLTRTWLWRTIALSRGVQQILHSSVSSSDVTTKPNFHTLLLEGHKHQREMRSWLSMFPPSLGAQEILQLQISVHNAWAPIITVACDVPGPKLLVWERERGSTDSPEIALESSMIWSNEAWLATLTEKWNR